MTTRASKVSGSATSFIATGKTGATQASAYSGATASGAPGSGTWAVGDFVIDQTGKLWICTAAGTPGTWTNVTSAPDLRIAQSLFFTAR